MTTLHAVRPPHVEIVKGRRRWYIRLVAANGEPLAVSQGYFSRWNATRAARKNFPGLQITDGE